MLTFVLKAVMDFFKHGTDYLPFGGSFLYNFYLIAMIIGVS